LIYILLNTAVLSQSVFILAYILICMLSRFKDNENVDKQKNKADLNERELYFSRRIKLGVRFVSA